MDLNSIPEKKGRVDQSRKCFLDNNKIMMVITDVDGVLTDGSMYYSENGELLKCFSTRDGMGFELLRMNNIIPVIITKENSRIVLSRAAKISVEEVHVGITDKLLKGLEIMNKYDIKAQNVAFIGDDINDLSLLEVVGFPCCPDDAEDLVKNKVKYICERKGGHGAFRELVNMIIWSNESKN
ncbi:KdsC family phosphatase [Methanoplanus endosymbiosus]|uniref:HAD hydrolase family protein n=1 Tax=Methanoplanus endosymbiosus TaxID=33865 RepID=A0A9E7PKC4_9EURY|nr:HAD hydrolase family protein [Methanoplanus endosymbiosus]UUX91673.1 HAD hydrolase family protein [Methanoplanus endosymbiosus]